VIGGQTFSVSSMLPARGMTSPVAYWHVEDIEAKLAGGIK
jgi:hypothetical protein